MDGDIDKYCIQELLRDFFSNHDGQGQGGHDQGERLEAAPLCNAAIPMTCWVELWETSVSCEKWHICELSHG
jgi:hypothetical protein